MSYYASWYYWKWSRVPAIVIIGIGSPWSLAWMYWLFDMSDIVPRAFRYFFNTALLSLFCSVNSVLLVLFWRRVASSWSKP